MLLISCKTAVESVQNVACRIDKISLAVAFGQFLQRAQQPLILNVQLILS